MRLSTSLTRSWVSQRTCVNSWPWAAAVSSTAARFPLEAVQRHSPVPAPPAILAIGMNYRAHVAEMGREAPEFQYWFNKQRTSIAGPGDPIVLPLVSTMVDY